MPKRQYLSIELVQQSLRYDDGKLFWLTRPLHHFIDERVWKLWNTRYAGKEAGCYSERNGRPRWVLGFNGRVVYRYRAVWVLCNGEWPGEIDHRNRDPVDDRIENLRVVTHAQNQKNMSRSKLNRSGFKGVHWYPPLSKWRAGIKVDGKSVFLGHFDDLAEAHAAYVAAAKKYHGEFFCAG